MHQVIAVAAQYVIEGAQMDRNNKTTRSVREVGSPIRVFTAYDDRDEAEFVATQVLDLLSQGTISSFADVGVLFRTNLQSRVLEEAFCRLRIPHRVVGAMRFYERKEVKDVVAFLRMLYNRHDTTSMERILNIPPRGIGPQTRRQIQAYAQLRNCSILDAMRDLCSPNVALGDEEYGANGVTGESSKRLQASGELGSLRIESSTDPAKHCNFTQLPVRKRDALSKLYGILQELRVLVAVSTPAELMKHVILKLDLEPYFKSQDKGRDRWDNVVELQAAAARFAHKGKDELGVFLEMAVLVADRHDPQERGQASLVTMHASKGLEFKVVMCVGMEEGTFPHHRSLQDSSQLNEERRLAFVALTRARDILYLTSRRTVPSTTSHQMPKVLSKLLCVCLGFDAARLVTDTCFQQDMPTKRSRFFLDIPSELCVEVCATGAPLLQASLSGLLVVLTRAAAESRASVLIRSQSGDIVTWQGLRSVALGLRCSSSKHSNATIFTDEMKTLPMRMQPFDLQAPYVPCGDQPSAISGLVQGLKQNLRFQTLRGATGTGKTFVMAHVINATQRPTLILAPNKMLAAQLCNELKEFFPQNKIEYFVSYYDYYRPEAYLAVSDVFVEKVSVVNDDIDRLRHSATRSLFERRDTVIVSSVSCIYGLGMPTEYLKHALRLYIGRQSTVSAVAGRLQEIHYVSNEIDELKRGQFLVTYHMMMKAHDAPPNTLCATLELWPAHTQDVFIFHFHTLPVDMSEEGEAEAGLDANTTEMHDADKAVMSAHSMQYKNVKNGPELETELLMYIANMTRRQRRREQDVSLNTTAAVAVAAAKVATDDQSLQTGNDEDCQVIEEVTIYPASHFVTSQDEKTRILSAIRSELQERVEELEDSGLFLEAERLTQRTEADLMQIETVGYCRGVWRA